jgi:uncharacterized repeat protein (TIGR03803 family)
LVLAVFSLTLSVGAQTEQVLTSFSSQPQGAYPAAGLIADSAGNLYGTNTGITNLNNFENAGGVVFKLAPNGKGGWNESVLHHFGVGYPTDGYLPYGALIFDAAGNLYGTTEYGGVYGCGTVYELYLVNGIWQEKLLYSFNCTPIYRDGPSNGFYPMGSLIFDSNGNLYGTTSQGGAGGCLDASGYYIGCGIVFELSPSANSWTEKTIYNFVPSNHDGQSPMADLIFDSAGNLYGTTKFGGYWNAGYGIGLGTVFTLQPRGNGTWSESIIYAFDGLNDGGFPTSGLIFDAAGNLYGTTGGIYGGPGSVFKLSPVGGRKWTETTLALPSDSVFSGSAAALTMDAAGNLFGTMRYSYAYPGAPPPWTGGNGAIFELSPNSSGGYTTSILYSFTGGTDGAQPVATVLRDQSGNLYTTTSCLGVCNSIGGSVFELSPTSGGWSPNVLYDFPITLEGVNPNSPLISDAAGNLYGVTPVGGLHQSASNATTYGTIFELIPSANGTWTTRQLYTFTGGADGANPVGRLVMDSAGNLYGAALLGGNSGKYCEIVDWESQLGECGTIFKLSPAGDGSWTFSLIYSFVGGYTDGANPAAGLLLDSAGNLYGVTSGGGASLYGTVFELSPSSSGTYTEKVIYSATVENNPTSPVVMDSNGNLYGGFVSGVYKLSPSGGAWTFSSLNAYADELYNVPGVTLDAAGNLYGVNFGGGGPADDGFVFQLTPATGGTWNMNKLYVFEGGRYGDGSAPQGQLVFDSAGNLYGTTYSGGTKADGCGYYGCGTVFKLTPSSTGPWTETILHAFNSVGDGATPLAGVIFDSNGNLFGTTYDGGSSNEGTVYKITP